MVIKNPPADQRQRPLMNHIVEMGDPGQQDAEDALADSGVLLLVGQDYPQGRQGGHGRQTVFRMYQVRQGVHGLLKFVGGKLAHHSAQELGDIAGDLLPTGFQFPDQVNDQFILLVGGQLLTEPHQPLAGIVPHRQMLTDAQKVAQVHRRVEGHIGICLHVLA